MKNNGLLKIGHRGAAGYELENTKSSILKALKLKVDYVEIDVYKCKSGELVLMHDNNIKRTTYGKGKVLDMTLKQLKQIRTKNDEQILTLQEAADMVKGKSKLVIELKAHNCEKELVTLLNKNKMIKDVIVCSFKHTVIGKIKFMDKRIKTALLERFPFFAVTRALLVKADYFHPNVFITTKLLVWRAHKSGLKVNVWVANSPKTIERLKRWNVDGLISDFPDRI